MNNCLCGCGLFARNLYISGHQRRNTKHSEKTKMLMSISRSGKTLSLEHRRKISISSSKEKNGFYGKSHSKETREKMSIIKIGKKLPFSTRLNMSLASKGKKKSEDHKRKMSLANKFKLDNHPNWRGGLSYQKYPIAFNPEFKRMIRNRDSHTCQLCGEKQEKRLLAIHHIDYNKKNTITENCISLCIRCHGITNYNREFWKNHFNDLIKKIGEM